LPSFEHLKSFEIEEKINNLKWHPRHSAAAHMLLTTNDKTVCCCSGTTRWLAVPYGGFISLLNVNVFLLNCGTEMHGDVAATACA
jgi:hypothetical protein